MTKRILFVCIHNSARSQMAEAFVNQSCCGEFEAYSAGIEPGSLNPFVVQAMREIGLDLSTNQTKSVTDMIETGMRFDFVVTVCDETSAERCPVVPGAGQRLHWSFPDPSQFGGLPDQKLARVREVRDAIRLKITSWCDQNCAPPNDLAA